MNDAVRVGSRLRALRAVVAVSMLAAGAGLWVAPADAEAGRPARVGGCRSGTVSLTFDDGPANGVTPQLLRILHRLQVPATFFMVGERVAAAPALARKVERAGYLIANHSYHHSLMTSQSSAQIQGTITATDRALRRAHVHPLPLVRPPYGGTNGTVERAIRGTGNTPVLWDIDSSDWEGGSAGTIASSILAALRPHSSNIVLQHDGVANSPASVAAVPRVVAQARRRGFCFVALDEHGRPGFPTPRVGLEVLTPTVSEGLAARVAVTLSKPAGRATHVTVRRAGGSATSRDLGLAAVRVTIPAGRLRAVVRIPVRRDGVDEPTERLLLRLGRPSGVSVGAGRRALVIRDVDPLPRVEASQVTVAEPLTDRRTVAVTFGLTRASARAVTLRVRTVAGTASTADYVSEVWVIRLAAGARRATVPLTILADTEVEAEESLGLEVVEATNARGSGATSRVTITPPP